MMSRFLADTPVGVYPLISLGLFLMVWILAIGWSFRKSKLELLKFSTAVLTDDQVHERNSPSVNQNHNRVQENEHHE